MRVSACFVPLLLVAALFLSAACERLPDEQHPPFSARELERFLNDLSAIARAAQQGVEDTGREAMETGELALDAIRHTVAEDLGWDRERFRHLLACCRDALSMDGLEAGVDDLRERINQAIPEGERNRLLAELGRAETALRQAIRRLETRTTATERQYILERMSRLRRSREDLVIMPNK